MNANELSKDRADILADELLAYHNKGVCGRAAKMLRQQQAEIEVLTKFLDETCQIGKFIVWNSTDKAQEK